MNQLEAFDEALTALREATFKAEAAGADAARIVRDMPRCSEDIEGALLELRDVRLMKAENFRRWPRHVGNAETNIYNDDEECRDHWSTACEREWKVVDRLSRIAEAIAIRNAAERAA